MTRRAKRSLADASAKTASGEPTEQEIYARPKADEDNCLILGNKSHHYPFGRYRVCLTPNQEKKLFGGKFKSQKKLGCGVFACAYTAPGKTKVIKFTRDSEDVAALLKAQKTGVVPKVYSVFKIKQDGTSIENGESTTVYALIVERLVPLTRPEREAADETLFGIRDVMGGHSTREEACGSADCGRLFEDVLAATKKLEDIGIEWRDIHSGNVAFDPKTGQVKIIDLGVTGTELKKRIKVLAGLRKSKLKPSRVSLIP